MSGFGGYTEEAAPFSPASCMSVSDSISSSSDPSPVPSPASPHQDELTNTFPRYRNPYEERLQPLSPCKSLTMNSHKPMPKRTHQSYINETLQLQFNKAVESGSYQELDRLLREHSECIDINQYDSRGQTPLQHFCSVGQLNVVQLLVRYGADPRLTSRDGWSTLHIATWSGDSDLMMYIMRCSRR